MKKYHSFVIILMMMIMGVQNSFAIDELVFNDEGRFIVPFTDLVATGDFTFDPETGELDGRGSEGSLYIKLPEGGLDMSEVVRIKVTVIKEEGWDDPIFGLRIFNQGVKLNANPWQSSKYNLDFKSVAPKATAVDCIEWISGNENQRKPGFITIESIVFEKDMTPDANALTLDMMKQWDGTGANAVVIGEAMKNTANNLGKTLGAAQLVFGGYEKTEYIDLTSYATLKLTCAPNTSLRFFFNNQAPDKSTYEIKKTAGTDGIISIDLHDERFTTDGFAHLIGIKTANGSSDNKVMKIQVYEPVLNALTSDMFKTWDSTGANAQPTGTANCKYVLNSMVNAGTVIYGDTRPKCYADLTEYETLRVEFTPGKTLRFLFNDLEDGNSALEIRLKSDDEGVITIPLHEGDLANYGFVHLLGIKTPYGNDGNDITVTKLQVFKKGEGGGSTAIHTVTANETVKDIYDLNGRRISHSADALPHLKRGIYIINCKKTVVR